MEYKIRYVKKQKAHKVKNRQDAGYTRIKIRGRKRWVKAKPPEKKEVPAQ